jgi:hypothetical protein
VDLSGVIFVALAVAWAGYLIPKALKHHDEVARTRSIDRFSGALRVLARREPVNRRDARLVVTSARAVSAGGAVATATRVTAEVTTEAEPSVGKPSSSAQAPANRPASARARRQAARVAARRRRRVLGLLLVATVATAVAAYFAYVPWWSIAVPVTLTVVWLVLCRTQVRRESLRDFEVTVTQVELTTEEPVLPHRAVQPPASTAVHVAGVDEEGDDVEDTIGIPVPVLDAVAVTTDDGGTLWEPLPVTLPTYVGKAQARRTVRTIDLGEPGTWTSGRTAEDAALVAKTEADRAAADRGDDGDAREAVGS